MSATKLFVLNNYPMDRVSREVKLGETPDQGLFGVNKLNEYGYEIVFLPYPPTGPWLLIQQLLSWLRFPIELGDLQQQFLTYKVATRNDIIYAPCGTQTHLLQYLYAFGLFRTPIVVLMHHPFPRGRLDFFRRWQRWLFIKGAHHLPCLGKRVAESLNIYGATDSKLTTLKWGPDLAFYGSWVPPGVGVIATGRTGRDFKTFAKAVNLSRCKSTIIGLEDQLGDPIFNQSPSLAVIKARNEQPVPGQDRGWLKYPKLCTYMQEHSAIAIPLFAQNSLAGLTSLMDALGLGRAVLMTRNPYIDIDIESEGIGFWLEPNNVDDWVYRLNWVEDHPEEILAMGKRAKCLADSTYNSDIFAHRLSIILHNTITGTQ